MSINKFICTFVLFNIIIYHYALFFYVNNNLALNTFSGIQILFSILIALFVINTFIYLLVSVFSIRVLKVFLILTMFLNSISVYFINTYNVILDKSMMGNIFNTRSSEIIPYYDVHILIYILFLGILPSYIVYKISIKHEKRLKTLLKSFLVLILGIFILYLNSSTWLWLDKHVKHIGALSLPWSYIGNSIRYFKKKAKYEKKQILLENSDFTNNNKMLVILVIGEAARANNFSLYGYDKKTNPLLEKQNISILKAKSVSTYTTASIHSMLSYKGSINDSYEPLPSYLQRQGLEVFWRSNNWGEDKINVSKYLKSSDLIKDCKSLYCNFDEVLLSNLKKDILNSKKDKIFVVLHTEGSHGPKYYKKYPKDFEVFKPVCKSVKLKECTKKELINAYDNTILYTDYFLNKTINTLKSINIKSQMIYVSDHGESLGEFGLYLHGAPNIIAPDFQRNIPLIVWNSDNKINKDNKNEYSHNNIFHTVLGSFGMNSKIYNNNLDLNKEK